MRRFRNIRFLSVLLAAAVSFGACRTEHEEPDGTVVYCIVHEGNALEGESVRLHGGTPEEKAGEMLKALQAVPEDVKKKSAIPKNIKILGCRVRGNAVEVDFDKNYYKMKNVREVLCRTAVVWSLTEIEGIDFVKFLVEGSPLIDKAGKLGGYMAAEDFLEHTGEALNSCKSADLVLYFTNAEGDGLVKREKKGVRYDSSQTLAALIVEQLIKGPSGEDVFPTLSPEVRLLDVCVKDGVCYLNFAGGFPGALYNVPPEITMQSIANSVIDGTGVRAVQVMVNGESDIPSLGIKRNQPFQKEESVVRETDTD